MSQLDVVREERFLTPGEIGRYSFLENEESYMKLIFVYVLHLVHLVGAVQVNRDTGL